MNITFADQLQQFLSFTNTLNFVKLLALMYIKNLFFEHFNDFLLLCALTQFFS